MGNRKGGIISDISKRVLIVEGRDELNRIMHIQEKDSERIIRYSFLGDDIYEIEIIQKVGSFYGAKAGDIY